MKNEKNFAEKLTWERVENLMLVSVLGQEPYRSQALKELRNRRLVKNSEQFIDAFMTNLGVVC
jgi:hypothetical protein